MFHLVVDFLGLGAAWEFLKIMFRASFRTGTGVMRDIIPYSERMNPPNICQIVRRNYLRIMIPLWTVTAKVFDITTNACVSGNADMTIYCKNKQPCDAVEREFAEFLCVTTNEVLGEVICRGDVLGILLSIGVLGVSALWFFSENCLEDENGAPVRDIQNMNQNLADLRVDNIVEPSPNDIEEREADASIEQAPVAVAPHELDSERPPRAHEENEQQHAMRERDANSSDDMSFEEPFPRGVEEQKIGASSEHVSAVAFGRHSAAKRSDIHVAENGENEQKNASGRDESLDGVESLTDEAGELPTSWEREHKHDLTKDGVELGRISESLPKPDDSDIDSSDENHGISTSLARVFEHRPQTTNINSRHDGRQRSTRNEEGQRDNVSARPPREEKSETSARVVFKDSTQLGDLKKKLSREDPSVCTILKKLLESQSLILQTKFDRDKALERLERDETIAMMPCVVFEQQPHELNDDNVESSSLFRGMVSSAEQVFGFQLPVHAYTRPRYAYPFATPSRKKGIKCAGKGGVGRHGKVLPDSLHIDMTTLSSIFCVAHRGSVRRKLDRLYEEARSALKQLKASATNMEHADVSESLESSVGAAVLGTEIPSPVSENHANSTTIGENKSHALENTSRAAELDSTQTPSTNAESVPQESTKFAEISHLCDFGNVPSNETESEDTSGNTTAPSEQKHSHTRTYDCAHGTAAEDHPSALAYGTRFAEEQLNQLAQRLRDVAQLPLTAENFRQMNDTMKQANDESQFVLADRCRQQHKNDANDDTEPRDFLPLTITCGTDSALDMLQSEMEKFDELLQAAENEEGEHISSLAQANRTHSLCYPPRTSSENAHGLSLDDCDLLIFGFRELVKFDSRIVEEIRSSFTFSMYDRFDDYEQDVQTTIVMTAVCKRAPCEKDDLSDFLSICGSAYFELGGTPNEAHRLMRKIRWPTSVVSSSAAQPPTITMRVLPRARVWQKRRVAAKRVRYC